ncbi:MAG: hypothetical protein ACP5NY_02685 [Thermocladium sp.]
MRGQGTLIMAIVIIALAAMLIYLVATRSPINRSATTVMGVPLLSVINSTAISYEFPYQPQLVLCNWVNSTELMGPLTCSYSLNRLRDGEWAINIKPTSGKYKYVQVTVVSSNGATASIQISKAPNCTVTVTQYPREEVVNGNAYLGYSIAGFPNGPINSAPISATVTSVVINGEHYPIQPLTGSTTATGSPLTISGVLNLNNLKPGKNIVTLDVSTACRVINSSTTFIMLLRLLNIYPFNINCLGSLTQSGSSITRVLYAYTLETSNGYLLNAFLGNITVTSPGQLQIKLPNSTSNVMSGLFYAENNTSYLKGSTYSSNKKVINVTLSSGSYTLNESLTFNSQITQRIVLLGSYAYNSQSGSINETILPVTANVMNLLNGVTQFYVPHIYQGDYQGNPTNNWPILIIKNQGIYWTVSSINQPILELVPISINNGNGNVNNQVRLAAGTMFWSEQYNGGNVTIKLIGTYSGGSSPPGDGFDIYLFINPWKWRVASPYNYSIPYAASDFNNGPNGITNFSPVQGDIILPYANPFAGSQYIMVQWNTFWQTGYSTKNSAGQFNIWIVNYALIFPYIYINVAPYPSPNLGSPYAGWDGYGSGYFAPHPGDYICITVTYVGKTNTLYASAIDLNTGQIASAQLSLNSYFTPPSPGSYVFGVGGSTATVDYANWGVVLINYTNPSP